MNIAVAALAILLPGVVLAQAVATRQVVGSGGTVQAVGGGVHISCTMGEPAVGTVQNPHHVATQGFQQGRTIGVITFTVETEPASCPTTTDGVARVVAIAGCAPPYTVLWSNGVEGVENTRLLPGNHSVTVLSQHCQGQYTFTVASGPASACIVRFFNALSPNADGINDTWVIENIAREEYANNTVEIFNRWGQPIWSGKNYDNQHVVWDGRTGNGKVLPAGTYYFVAHINGVVHKGFVELTK